MLLEHSKPRGRRDGWSDERDGHGDQRVHHAGLPPGRYPAVAEQLFEIPGGTFESAT
jgi:hypothetical protein